MAGSKNSLKRDATEIEKQVEQLVDRIVDSNNATAVSAYERKIAQLARDKHLALEKLEDIKEPVRPFKEMFELAFGFPSNPWNLWDSERLENKRTVLKLTFAKWLAYSRETGFRTRIWLYY